MERRSFIKHTGLAGILAAGSAPAFAQGAPAIKWRLRVELPEVARHDLRRGRSHVQGGRGGDRRQVPDPGVRGRRDRPGLAGRRRRAERHRRNAATRRRYYYFGKDPTFAFGTVDPVRPQRPPVRTPGGIIGGGEQADATSSTRNTTSRRSSAATPARRWAAGSARRSRRRRPQGPQDAHRRLRGPGADEARRRAAADRRRRHLSGAGKGHDRRRRVGRSVRRREARLQQGRQVLLLPGLVGRRSRRCTCSSTSRRGRSCRRNTRRSSTRPAPKRNIWMLAKYDAQNPAALKRLVGERHAVAAVLRRTIMDACYKAAHRAVRGDDGEERRSSRRSTTSDSAFRNEQILWFRVDGEHASTTSWSQPAGHGGGGEEVTPVARSRIEQSPAACGASVCCGRSPSLTASMPLRFGSLGLRRVLERLVRLGRFVLLLLQHVLQRIAALAAAAVVRCAALSAPGSRSPAAPLVDRRHVDLDLVGSTVGASLL